MLFALPLPATIQTNLYLYRSAYKGAPDEQVLFLWPMTRLPYPNTLAYLPTTPLDTPAGYPRYSIYTDPVLGVPPFASALMTLTPPQPHP